MKYSLFLTFSLLFFASCEPTSPYQYEEDSFIEIKKDPCFGFCPVYSFKVNGNGQANFKGDRNVSKEGEWQRQLTPEETNELFAAFEEGDFWGFDEEYTSQVTDLPTTWITLHLGDKSKTVKDYYGAPEGLKALEKLVETIAEEDLNWSKVAE